ncbi:hypothetical protein Baya_6696 [Bagarius yarrelli]|uniref:Uncharacterized protein n=1 Tax=Bagarius yarrelli TaxID=175774 RepID=A0A556U1K9_BAGYA|nr:hypothetical protein Baya_6696 [Bagarius yarrelli]
MSQRGKTRSPADPGRTGPIDYSPLDPYLIPDEAGVSGTHTDNGAAEIPPQMETLADAQRRCKEALESNTLLKRKNSYLMSKVNILEDELSRTRISHNDVMGKLEDEQEERCVLEFRCKELNEILKKREELQKDYEQEVEANATLKATLVELETKYLQVMESNLTLQNEKSELHDLVLDMKNKYSESENNLKIQQIQQTIYVKDLTLLENEKKALEDALAQSTSELENVHSQARQLEDECAILIANMGRLEDELHRVENSFTRVQTASEDLMRDYDHKERMLNNLKVKWKTMNETVLNNYEEQIQVHGSLRLQHKELKEQYDQLVKDRENEQLSLAMAMESSALLQRENSELVFQVKTLQRSMTQLKEELFGLRRQNKEMEQGPQQGTSRIAQLQLDPASLTEVDRYLIATLAETENKLTRAMRYAAMFEEERAELRYRINVLQNSVHELEQMLSDAELKCDFIKQEKNQAVETLNIVRMQCTNVHQTFPQCDNVVTSPSEDLEPKKDDLMKPT